MSHTKDTVIVIAKCIACDFKKEIKAGEVPIGENPMCPNCFMPMVAESAKAKKGVTK